LFSVISKHEARVNKRVIEF